MGEVFQSYGFLIVIAALMLVCHLVHPGRGGAERDKGARSREAKPDERQREPGAVLLGLVESVLYGVYAGLVYAPIHNFFARRFGAPVGG